jgi:hypothetical protein
MLEAADGCSRLVRALAPGPQPPSRRNGQPAPATPGPSGAQHWSEGRTGQRVVPGLTTHRGESCLWQRICQWPCQCRQSGDAEFDRIDSRYASVLGAPTAQLVTAGHLLIRWPSVSDVETVVVKIALKLVGFAKRNVEVDRMVS